MGHIQIICLLCMFCVVFKILCPMLKRAGKMDGSIISLHLEKRYKPNQMVSPIASQIRVNFNAVFYPHTRLRNEHTNAAYARQYDSNYWCLATYLNTVQYYVVI